MRISNPQNQNGRDLVALNAQNKIDTKHLDLLTTPSTTNGLLNDERPATSHAIQSVINSSTQNVFTQACTIIARHSQDNPSQYPTVLDQNAKHVTQAEKDLIHSNTSDIDNLEKSLYGKPALVGGVDSFNGTYTMPLAGFEVKPADEHVPAKIRSFIIHDVQNTVTLEEPIVAACSNGVSSNKIYSWKTGDDIEFIFDEIIDVTTLPINDSGQYVLNVLLTPDPNHADATKLPSVNLDRNVSYAWWNNAKGINTGSGAWNGEWKNYAPNISFRYDGLEVSVDNLQNGDFVTHPEIADFITESSLTGIKSDITNLQNGKADKSELNNKANSSDLNNYVTKTSLLEQVTTRSLVVTGNQIEWSTNTNNNLDLGYRASLISPVSLAGNINLGNTSTIKKPATDSEASVMLTGTLSLGGNSTVENGTLNGAVATGYGVTLTNGTYGSTLSLGRTNTISSGSYLGVVNVGSDSTINGGVYKGVLFIGSNTSISASYTACNIISGSKLSVNGGLTSQKNTWIVSSFTNDIKSQLRNRYGVIFKGNGDALATPSDRYEILYPNIKDKAALITGYVEWENDFNVIDASGTEIIKNGVFTVTGSIDEAELNRILATKGYLTSSDLDNYVTSDQIATKADSSEVESLKSEIQSLQETIKSLQDQLATFATKTYVDDNFIKGVVVSEDELPEESDRQDDHNYFVAPDEQ